MADEIRVQAATGQTLYCQIFNGDPNSADYGKVRDVVADAWDTFAGADWGDYDVALTERDTSRWYFANLPTGLDNDDVLDVSVFIQAGGSPAKTDLDHAHGTLGEVLMQALDDGTNVFDRTTDSLQALRDNQSGSTTATDETVVPASRTAVLRRESTGLEAQNTIGLQVGEIALIAIDFVHDLATRPKAERILSVGSIALESGAGITFGTPAKLGSQAKVASTAVTAGTWLGQATVTYTDSMVAIGDFTIVVTDAT